MALGLTKIQDVNTGAMPARAISFLYDMEFKIFTHKQLYQ